ncbi:MAG: stage II sporulation protein M [Thermoguttaceae bacterium]|nr:stage II sporulation protein M [Thermoguttaceae bacterium]
MTISELIAAREPDWKALENLIDSYSSVFRRKTPEDVAKLTSLYRAASSDLALAESYQLPEATIGYLNNLVGRAHNCLYRKRRVLWSEFWRVLFFDAPRWIVSEPTFWVALALFWIPFCVCEYKCMAEPEFAEQVVGGGQLDMIRSMYSNALDEDPVDRLDMVAFYAYHNGSIGLRSFCLSVLGLVPGLLILVSNAVALGSVFGYMQSGVVGSDVTANFLEFTTAHGPFELTAIVLSAAAGMRIGFGLIKTGGYSRLDSIRRAAIQAFPTIAAALTLFCLAATIEGLFSPSRHQWFCDLLGVDSLTLKKGLAGLSTALLIFYFAGLGGIGFVKNRFFQR